MGAVPKPHTQCIDESGNMSERRSGSGSDSAGEGQGWSNIQENIVKVIKMSMNIPQGSEVNDMDNVLEVSTYQQGATETSRVSRSR